MPRLEWIGKEKVVNHHLDVPFRVLNRKYSFDQAGQQAEDNGSQNKIIHGDNLLALKSLLPEYEGKIKCIYIDPPYNTGNEGWVYNDNVNSPKIKKWLGEVVGKEGDDLSRHDKWLCMMYPRLKLLQKLLADDGAIFISLDDNEIIYLRAIMDEIFGNSGFVAQVTLLCNPKGRSQDKYFATCHEYLLVYTKKILPPGSFSITKGSNKIQKDYRLTDNNGAYRLLELRNTHREFGKENRPNLWYPIFVAKDGTVSLEETENHREPVFPYWADGFEGCWTWGKELTKKDLYLLVGQQKKGIWKIYRKSYAVSDKGEIVKQKPFSIWNNPLFYTEKGQRTFGKIFPGANKNDFPQPKSVDYIAEIIQTITANDDIILDSFAGSGTTAQAVLKLNQQDGGNRKFILIEMMDYADSVTAERAKAIISGYSDLAGIPGDFSYYEIGEPLLDGDVLNPRVAVEQIRSYIWYMETRHPYQKPAADNEAFLGQENGTAYYFHYDPAQRRLLDEEFLRSITMRAEHYVIYADECLLSEAFLQKHAITFKKIPRDIARL